VQRDAPTFQPQLPFSPRNSTAGNNVITAKRERHTLALGDSGFDGSGKEKKSAGDERGRVYA